jgi:hypothetical protein
VADFGWAATALKEGRLVRREPWTAKGIWLRLERPGASMTLPFMVVRRSSGDIAPWQACHNDLLATDWIQ